MKKLGYLLSLAIALLTLGSGKAAAQATASGTIQGTISDQTQAVIQGAEVTAKNKGTDLTRSISTSETGYYRFELLPIGTYIVTIGKAGFATATSTVEVMVGQAISLDVILKPGSANELIEVTSDVPLIDQAKTSIS